jgi:hypothetical protein
MGSIPGNVRPLAISLPDYLLNIPLLLILNIVFSEVFWSLLIPKFAGCDHLSIPSPLAN